MAVLTASLLDTEPEAWGLAALLTLAQSRAPARVGRPWPPLDEQDTSLWDQALIIEGEALLRRAHGLGAPLGRFQLEAAIQSVHCDRAVTGTLDRTALVKLYRGLIAIAPTKGAPRGPGSIERRRLMPREFPELTHPIVQAPMSGGPSTPELAAAVANAGGLGFVAAGYRTATQLRADIEAARALSDGPVGVNLFLVSEADVDDTALGAYARDLEPVAARYGVELGHRASTTTDWRRNSRWCASCACRSCRSHSAAPYPTSCAHFSRLGLRSGLR